jgi:hypothetical protein
MAFLSSSELITFIPEVAPGTFNTAITTTNVDVRLRDTEWKTDIELDNESSEYRTGTWFGADESIIGKKFVSASATVKVAPGEYTPATVPLTPTDAGHKLNYDFLFESCGMTKVAIDTLATDDDEGLYVFYPDQANSQKTLSMARIVYDAAEDKYQVDAGAGAVGNFTINAEGTAKPFMVKFDFSGRSQQVTEIAGGSPVAKLDETNVMRTVADAMRNTTVKITNLSTAVETSFCITKFGLESGNELNQVECQSTDSGILNYIITKINPSFTIDPLLKTLTQFNWYSAITNETFYKVEIDSEFLSIYIPRAQIQTSEISDSNGSLRNSLKMRPLMNLDNDAPTWLPVINQPTELSPIPYFIGIKEKLKDY